MSAPGPKVLLIEDEKQIRRFVRVAVEEEGCHVVEAETMAQGLIEAGLGKPDLLILDLGLPAQTSETGASSGTMSADL